MVDIRVVSVLARLRALNVNEPLSVLPLRAASGTDDPLVDLRLRLPSSATASRGVSDRSWTPGGRGYWTGSVTMTAATFLECGLPRPRWREGGARFPSWGRGKEQCGVDGAAEALGVGGGQFLIGMKLQVQPGSLSVWIVGIQCDFMMVGSMKLWSNRLCE